MPVQMIPPGSCGFPPSYGVHMVILCPRGASVAFTFFDDLSFWPLSFRSVILKFIESFIDPSNFSSPKFNSYLHPFPPFPSISHLLQLLPSCGVSARISFLMSSKLSTSSATLAPCPANNLGIWSAVDCKYNAELSRTLWKTRDPAWVERPNISGPTSSSFSRQKTFKRQN